MTRLALVVVFAGCFSTPTFRDRDGGVDADAPLACASKPSEDGLGLSTNPNGEQTVGWGEIALTFANDGNRYPYPIELQMGKEQLIRTTEEGCNIEDTVGVAVYPTYSIAGRQTPTVSDGHGLDRTVVGRAYTELKSNWRFAACNFAGDGETTWSIYATGRIVRYDYFRPTTTNAMSASACVCPSGDDGSFVVTSYTSLERGPITSFTAWDDEEEGATPLPSAGSETTDNVYGGCFLTSDRHRLAYRFDDFPNAPASRLRNEDAYVFVRDIMRNSASIAPGTAFQAKTQYLLSDNDINSGDCERMNQTLDNHDAPPSLAIAGTDRPQDSTGLYALATEQTSAFSIRAGNGRIENGFAIRVFMPMFQAVSTTADGRVWWQRESDGTFYIVFEEGLANGESIMITPECGP